MGSEQRARELIAQECARMMLDDGIWDYAAAKRKATQRLMVDGRVSLPSNLEIEAAILKRRRLFADTEELAELQGLREAALKIMRRLEGFEPRLVGAVLKGTAGIGARATLHAFADTPEELLFALMERGLRYREAERMQRIAGVQHSLPSVVLHTGGAEVEVVVFPSEGLRQAPPSPVDGRPMRRADVGEVAALVEARLADILDGERCMAG